MPILYGVISRGTAVLARYASCSGNFAEVVDAVLAKISPETPKLTYTHQDYLFHYILEDRIIYMCITTMDFERTKAFAYLAEIQRKFKAQFGMRAQTALPFSMNSDFSLVLANEMRVYSSTQRPARADDPTTLKLQRNEQQVEELKEIMVRNVDTVLNRGERLELLVEKTDNLNANAVSFKMQSTQLKRSLWWKNIKIIIVGVVLLLIFCLIISMIACGTANLAKCHK